MAQQGTYTLLVAVQQPIELDVGALGTVSLPEGACSYTGSALSQGGFKRIERHRRIASGASSTRHWHIDYLLGQDACGISTVYKAPGQEIECQVARAIDAERIPGFGCSDCDCRSHLHLFPDRDTGEQVVAEAYNNMSTGYSTETG